MSDDAAKTGLKVYYLDPDDDDKDELFLGELALDSADMLSVVSAMPDYAEDLQSAVDELNGKDALRVKTAPPPGTPMLQLHGRFYERGSAYFLEGLKLYALAHYSFRLVSAADEAGDDAELEKLSL